MLQFALKPTWGINYVTHEGFKLPQLDEHVDMSGGAMSIGRYFTEMLDPSMNWDDVAAMVQGVERPVLPEGRHVGGGRAGARSTSAAPASCCPTMAAGSWTARARRSISWPRSSMPWATGST